MDNSPLCSIEAEQAVLGSILINNLAYHQVAGLLRPEHFFEPIHARTFEAVERVIGMGQVADYLTLGAEMRAWADLQNLGNLGNYLGSLARCAETVLNTSDYADAHRRACRAPRACPASQRSLRRRPRPDRADEPF